MGNAQNVSFKFENYIFNRLFRKILDRENLCSEFGRLCYIAYVFILRLPSEALPDVRAAPTDDLLKRSPPPGNFQALIGIRFFRMIPKELFSNYAHARPPAGAPSSCAPASAMRTTSAARAAARFTIFGRSYVAHRFGENLSSRPFARRI